MFKKLKVKDARRPSCNTYVIKFLKLLVDSVSFGSQTLQSNKNSVFDLVF